MRYSRQIYHIRKSESQKQIIKQYFGLKKDNHHKTRAIVGKNGEIAIKQTRAVFTLVSSIQDEVHRFAIGYHHKKQRKSMLTMQLTDIEGIGKKRDDIPWTEHEFDEGIGKKRAESLIKHFKDINKIATAEIDELLQAKGITKSTAEKIYNYYRK